MDKKAQEEMIGFALIIIIVSVIFLAFLGLSLSDEEKDSVESYEVESFVGSFLQYSSDCKEGDKSLEISDLIEKCSNNQICGDRESCEILEGTLEGISEESWNPSPENPVKGYELKISSPMKNIINITKGDITANSKGAIQLLKNNVEIIFKAYY
jgi:hypothetical protein